MMAKKCDRCGKLHEFYRGSKEFKGAENANGILFIESWWIGSRRVSMNSNPCLGCGFNDPDFGCTCPSNEMWYACPLSPDPSPEDFMTEEEVKHGS